MTILESLMERLQSLKGLDDETDAEIALLLGWKRRQERGTTFWLVPKGEATGNPPRCTTHINDAYKLVNALLPGHAAAFVWREEEATARVDFNGVLGPILSATTPSIAICLVVFEALLRSRKDRQPIDDANQTEPTKA
jgi:hypothetical protein